MYVEINTSHVTLSNVIDEITAIRTPRKSIKKKGTEICERSVWKFGRKGEREREREREREKRNCI